MDHEWVRAAKASDRDAVLRLLESENLPPEFVLREFVVCESRATVVGCARARPLPEGGTELASVVVAPGHRGRGLARSLVTIALLGARHPVYALTLVPELATRAGFEPIDASQLPASLQPKAASCACGDRAWRAMRMRRVQPTISLASPSPGPPDFLDA